MSLFMHFMNNNVYVSLVHGGSITGVMEGVETEGIFITEDGNIVFVPYTNIAYINYRIEDDDSEETFIDFEETEEELKEQPNLLHVWKEWED